MKPHRPAPIIAFALLLFSLAVAPAQADDAKETAHIYSPDALSREEAPLKSFGWAALGWAGGTVPTGQVTTSGWGPQNAFPAVSGAYWYAPLTDSGGRAGVGLRVNTSPGLENRYVSVWLHMPNPTGGVRSGYQLRWTLNPDLSTYTVKISKWVVGVETVLATKTSVSLAPGTRVVLADSGSALTAWVGSGSPMTPLVSVADNTFSGGYAGMEASGNISRSEEFQAESYGRGRVKSLPLLDSLHTPTSKPLPETTWTKVSGADDAGGTWILNGHFGYGMWVGPVSSAYWNSQSFSDATDGVGVATKIVLGAAENESISLLLNGSNLDKSTKSAYEAKFSGAGFPNSYVLELAKISGGVRTVLASRETSVRVGDVIGLTESRGSLVVWGGNPVGTLLISADPAFTAGYAGIGVTGVWATVDNFRAGPLVHVPNIPTLTKSVPSVSSNDNSPELFGISDYESTVELFTNNACTGAPAISAPAETLENSGITVAVPDNTTTTFFAKATNGYGSSSCSASGVTYTEDSAPPAAPTFTSVNPASIGNNNAPKIRGTAEAGSSVKLYTSSTCTGTAVSGTAAAFSSPGIAMSVPDNSVTSFWATARDVAGNASSCSSTSITYTEDSTPPPVPTVSSTTPKSGSDNNSPLVLGTAEAGSTVKLYTNSTCTSTVAATGTAAAFASPGLTVSLEDNQTKAFWATTTDAAGNVSGCSTTSVTYEELTPTMYWGAWVKLEGKESPFEPSIQEKFEGEVGKSASLIHWSSPWYSSTYCGGFCSFQKSRFEYIRSHGSIPFFSWSPEGQGLSAYQLTHSAEQDAYVKKWAEDAKAWGKPFFLRFGWEMNGNWMAWGVGKNGNTTATVKELWIHVHEIFDSVGGVPATWVWCPNINDKNSDGSNTAAFSTLYPGDKWVDWTCLDGYNKNTPWRTFDTTFKASYQDLVTVAPSKPFVIGEVAAVEGSTSTAKGEWITAMFNSIGAGNYPNLHGLLWFNKDNEGLSYPIGSSTAARTAFATGIQKGRFAPAQYSAISTSPILPPP